MGTSVVVVFHLKPFCSTNNFPKLYFLYRNVLLLRLKNAVTWEGIGVAFLMFIKEKSPKQGQYHEKAYPIASEHCGIYKAYASTYSWTRYRKRSHIKLKKHETMSAGMCLFTENNNKSINKRINKYKQRF